MNRGVPGTDGYEAHLSRFVEISQSLDFETVCKDFIPFLPAQGKHVLDLGSGIGQNAASLDKLGYHVTALEALPAFVEISRTAYQGSSVTWYCDSLPNMTSLNNCAHKFSFVLIDGVWHHLDELERGKAAYNLASLIANKGRCAISLRNGPAGMGGRVFPTSASDTISLFQRYGFSCVLDVRNQASILPNKESVTWSRLVLEKQ